MAEGLNRVQLLGNLGSDPDLRWGDGPDSAVLRIRMATTEHYFDKRTNEKKERTDWISVVLFGRRAEALSKILFKGSRIHVEGRLRSSSYEKDGKKIYQLDVVGQNVILLGDARGGAREADHEDGSEERRGTRTASRQQAAPATNGRRASAPARGAARPEPGDAAEPPDDLGPDPGGFNDDIPF